jgi:RNA-directed DNA polymerase
VRFPGPTHLVMGFEHREDAERLLSEFGERLAKFGLELHPEKTRLIEFGRFAESNRRARGEGKPETFDFLGFTHYCGFKKGRFIVWRKTAAKRMRAKLRQLKQELRRRMHEPLAQIGEWLGRVQRGYYQYHAVPGNRATLRTRSSERDAVSEMKEDPSESACRRRLQTAISCCRPMAMVVNVMEKA